MWGHEIIIDGRSYGHSALSENKRHAAQIMRQRGIKGEPIKCPHPTREQRRDNTVY